VSRVRALSAGCVGVVVDCVGVIVTTGAGVLITGVDVFPPTGVLGGAVGDAGIGLSLPPFGLPSRVGPSVRGRFPFVG